MAQSGIHPLPGGAKSSSMGGAIQSGGSLIVRGAAIGHCVFADNSAVATAGAASAEGTATSSSAGGAIAYAGTLELPEGACTFTNNGADSDVDLHFQDPTQ